MLTFNILDGIFEVMKSLSIISSFNILMTQCELWASSHRVPCFLGIVFVVFHVYKQKAWKVVTEECNNIMSPEVLNM